MKTGGRHQYHGVGPTSSEASPRDSSTPGWFMGFDSRPHQQQRQEKSIRSLKVKQDFKISVTAQLKAMQALAKERNIDLSNPENAKLMTQLFPQMQSQMLAQRKTYKRNTGALSIPVSMLEPVSPHFAREGSSCSNSSQAREMMLSNNAMFSMQSQQESMNLNQGLDNLSNNNIESILSGSGMLQMQNACQSNRSSVQSDDVGNVSSQGALSLPISMPPRKGSPNSSKSREIMISDNTKFSMQPLQESSPGMLLMQHAVQSNHSSVQSDEGGHVPSQGDVAADNVLPLAKSFLHHGALSSQVAREGSPNSSKSREIMMSDNAIFSMQPQQEFVNLNQGLDNLSNSYIKSTLSGLGMLPMQNAWQSNHSSLQSDEVGHVSSQGDVVAQNVLPLAKSFLHHGAPTLPASSSQFAREGSSSSSKSMERIMNDNVMFLMQPQQESVNLNQGLDTLSKNYVKSTLSGSGVLPMQNALQSNRSSVQSDEGGHVSSQDVVAHNVLPLEKSFFHHGALSSQFAREGSPNSSKSREIMMSDNALFSMQSQQESVNLNQRLDNLSNNYIKSFLSGSGMLLMQNAWQSSCSSVQFDRGHVSSQGDVEAHNVLPLTKSFLHHGAPSLPAPMPISSFQFVKDGSPISSKSREIMMSDNAMSSMQSQQESMNLNQGLYNLLNNNIKSTLSGSGLFHLQNSWQSNLSSVQSGDVAAHTHKYQTGFTKKQFNVLTAQVFAFKRLKKGLPLPPEMLQRISPPPLED